MMLARERACLDRSRIAAPIASRGLCANLRRAMIKARVSLIALYFLRLRTGASTRERVSLKRISTRPYP